MYFDLTDEQQAIKSTAHDFLASRFKSERMREIAASDDGFDESGWKEMAELGWAGLALPEEWGGQGLGIVDLAVLFEEMGYALRSLAAALEHDRRPGAGLCGSDEQKRALAAAAGRGRAARHAGALVDAGAPADAGRLHDGGRGRRRRRRPRRREDAGAWTRPAPTSSSSPPPTAAATSSSSGADGRHRHRRRSRSTPPAASPRSASTASGSPPQTRCPAASADY